ncbi:hypothetical protein ANN_26331 [Periplaneta americana]|uniref:FP protein C-terminal domain-containing protein n=1 Tax=Periplaneta americana TaxID=6978 RepID=A0ABQ8S5L1_PERAM|nr:hypothetical protein ANN_26331 [Periplaneta americana]
MSAESSTESYPAFDNIGIFIFYGIATKKVNRELPEGRITAGDQLTAVTRDLLNKTRDAARLKNYKFVWTRDGNIIYNLCMYIEEIPTSGLRNLSGFLSSPMDDEDDDDDGPYKKKINQYYMQHTQQACFFFVFVYILPPLYNIVSRRIFTKVRTHLANEQRTNDKRLHSLIDIGMCVRRSKGKPIVWFAFGSDPSLVANEQRSFASSFVHCSFAKCVRCINIHNASNSLTDLSCNAAAIRCECKSWRPKV